MADVVISYAPEDEAAAGQLDEALAKAGYEVWRPASGSGAANSDAVTERIVSAKAAVVLWSGAAAASEWVRAEANVARALKKLVQVSADGSAPPIPFDATQVSAISDSEAVRAGVAALAGTPVPPEPEPEPAPESLSDPAPLPPSGPAPVGAASTLSAPAPRRRGPSLGLIIILLFVLIVLGAAGYVFWQRSQPPAAAPDAVETNLATPAESAEPAEPDLPQDVPLPGGIDSSAPLPADETLNGLAPAPGVDAPTATPAQPQARPAAPPRRAEPRVPRQRIRKENSQVMEDYCAYAGRNTPQCRRFRQSN